MNLLVLIISEALPAALAVQVCSVASVPPMGSKPANGMTMSEYDGTLQITFVLST